MVAKTERHVLVGLAAATVGLIGFAGPGASKAAAAAPAARSLELPGVKQLVSEASAASASSTVWDGSYYERVPESAHKRAALYEGIIEEEAALAGVDPRLVWTVMRIESDFKLRAHSPAAADGLMQFIPATARRFGVDTRNARSSIRGGCAYLKFLLARYDGDVDAALAAYNAGEGAVDAYRYGFTIYRKGRAPINPGAVRTQSGIPPYAETRRYVARARRVFRSVEWDSKFSGALVARHAVRWPAASLPTVPRAASPVGRVETARAAATDVSPRVSAPVTPSGAARGGADVAAASRTETRAEGFSVFVAGGLQAEAARFVDPHSGSVFVIAGEHAAAGDTAGAGAGTDGRAGRLDGASVFVIGGE